MRGFEKLSNFSTRETRPLSQRSQEIANRYTMVREWFAARLNTAGTSDQSKKPLNVDNIIHSPPPDAALLLAEQIDLGGADPGDLALLLRWAIKHNSAELVEDLWDICRPLVNRPGHGLQSLPFWGVEMNSKLSLSGRI
jgi:hypothetical protein